MIILREEVSREMAYHHIIDSETGRRHRSSNPISLISMKHPFMNVVLSHFKTSYLRSFDVNSSNEGIKLV
jgi:hypothetical protein